MWHCVYCVLLCDYSNNLVGRRRSEEVGGGGRLPPPWRDFPTVQTFQVLRHRKISRFLRLCCQHYLLVHIIIAACEWNLPAQKPFQESWCVVQKKWQLLAWLWLHHQMGLSDRPTDCLCVCASKSNVKNNEDLLYNEKSEAEKPSRRLSLFSNTTHRRVKVRKWSLYPGVFFGTFFASTNYHSPKIWVR